MAHDLMDRRTCIHPHVLHHLGTIVAALCVLFTRDLAVTAHYGLRGQLGFAEMTPLPASPYKQGLLSQQEKDGPPLRNSLKLRLLHMHDWKAATGHHQAGSSLAAHDRIVDFIQMDEMRVMGLYGSGKRARDSQHLQYDDKQYAGYPTSTISVAPPSMPAPNHLAPPPQSPIHEKLKDFEGKVISGASFPGHIGQYFVEFYVGTPGQRFLFITDTGSDLVWVPCSPACKSCSSSSSSSAFLPEASSTFVPIQCSAQECTLIPPPPGATCNAQHPTQCTYAYGYSDLSQTTGIFAYDTIAMRSSSGSPIQIKHVAFGCGTNNTGPSINNVGGVIGLGQGPISFSSQVGPMYGRKFSYCFSIFFNKKSTSALVFGDDQAGTEFKSPIQYTPFVRNPEIDTFYHLQIEQIEVQGQPLHINSSVFEIDKEGNGGLVIDSGTTLSFFLKPAYDAIFEAFQKAIRYPRARSTGGLPLCYNISSIHKPTFPRVSIIFKGGAIFRPPPRNYFLSPTPAVRCLGFMSSSGLSVLGNLIQQNYYVEYDRQNNQLGFAKANCSTTGFL